MEIADLSPEVFNRLEETFFPYLAKKRARILKRGLRFVHYTDGEAAQSIIRNKAVWLRSTTCMNDFSEVRHGLGCFAGSWHGDSGKALRSALNKCHPNIDIELNELFERHAGVLVAGSFVVCFSEHMPREREHGRLSMWRAYGNNTGIGLVLNPAPFFLKTNALNAFSSPVAYLDDNDYRRLVAQIAAAAEAQCDVISMLSREAVRQLVFNMFRFGILCTKHPAFAEEREWRVTFTPAINPSRVLLRNVRTMRGVTQTMFDIPLKNIPAEGLVGIEVPELIERVIVGPTQYFDAVREAFWWALHDAGFAKPHDLIIRSGVPLRT